MNKEDVIKLYNAIENEKTKGSVKFRYALLKNQNLIKHEIEAFTEIETGMEKIIEPLNKERGELIKEIGSLNEATNEYTIKPEETEKINEFTEKFNAIQEKYKTSITEYNRSYAEYKEMLKEDLEAPLKLYEVKIENCPEDLGTESLETFMKCEIIK
ncbi:hypothetical protein SAMN02745134_00245 [Clostridium acidisoli DSM 12555]|uniref:Uncharacterized protein n=1 Tax=Clostridium acidisoli DSM 12555 TaxID=1121291 RepID=A0A1W1X0B9_9CLOT|nr:hypothetical protein [Clostridium acidisoli]SMC17148.1 hypothetical protein SAMN02745134_00245 [Clostridium acidisoli DSM 12555]